MIRGGSAFGDPEETGSNLGKGDVNRPIVATDGLTKRYGGRAAVEDLNLAIYRGDVYGFLGPNGAGKTTTMRMLVGLIKPTSGSAAVLDEPPGSPEALGRIGALIESPAFYPYLSGYDNLDVVARLSGVDAPEKRVSDALEQVGLTRRADDKYKKYSQGMKQRLGVAAALLKSPELLILDEPTNGLDPQGMAEMRELIKALGRENTTILLSSHLMSEVEQVCNRIGVIRDGRLIAEEKVLDLRGKGGLLVRAEPLQAAVELVRAIEGVEAVEIRDGAIHIRIEPERAPEIGKKLFSAGINVMELKIEHRSLEEVFLELTEEGIR